MVSKGLNLEENVTRLYLPSSSKYIGFPTFTPICKEEDPAHLSKRIEWIDSVRFHPLRKHRIAVVQLILKLGIFPASSFLPPFFS